MVDVQNDIDQKTDLQKGIKKESSMEFPYTEIEKRRIMAILEEKQELQSLSIASLYTCNSVNKWIHSGMYGFLCYVLDYENKISFLAMYDCVTYEKQFKFCCYKNFSNYYTVLQDNFHCFETDIDCFFGLEFHNLETAKEFANIVYKFNDNFKNLAYKKYLSRRKKIIDYAKILHEKYKGKKKNFLDDLFSASTDIYKYLNKEDKCSIEISRPLYFKLLSNVEYDHDKKIFITRNIPKDILNMFQNLGIRKSTFRNREKSLLLFKSFIEMADEIHALNKLKTAKLKKIDKYIQDGFTLDQLKLLEEAKRKSLLSMEEVKFTLSKQSSKGLDQKKSSMISNSSGNTHLASNENSAKKSSHNVIPIPSVPLPPMAPPIPAINLPALPNSKDTNEKTLSISSNDNQKEEPKTKVSTISMEQQLLSIKLRKVDPDAIAKRPIQVTDPVTMNDIEALLKNKLRERDQLIRGNQDSDDEDSDF